jgi:hypothetical protein
MSLEEFYFAKFAAASALALPSRLTVDDVTEPPFLGDLSGISMHADDQAAGLQHSNRSSTPPNDWSFLSPVRHTKDMLVDVFSPVPVGTAIDGSFASTPVAADESFAAQFAAQCALEPSLAVPYTSGPARLCQTLPNHALSSDAASDTDTTGSESGRARRESAPPSLFWREPGSSARELSF